VLYLGIATAAAASAALNAGVVLQALDAREAPADERLRVALLLHLVRRKRWIAGFLLISMGFGLQLLALAWAPFVVVQPMLAAGLLLVLYLGVRILGERIGLGQIVGVMGIIGGIALLAWGTPAGTETVRSQLAVISVIALLSVAALAPFALRGRGRLDSATFVIVASGLAFGAGNIATKLISDSLSDDLWLPALIWYLVVVATVVIAFITEMTALQLRPATLVVPLTLSVQTFLPVLLEPLYLSERWGTAALGGVPLIAGLAFMLFGSVVVARTRAVSGLVGNVP
jgi:drug/metabolite transporter (DMT)-like permease